MAYLAGMIWSVSMLAPNFQALPRRTLGKVTASPPHLVGRSRAQRAGGEAHSGNPRLHVLQPLARVRDDARHRARRGHRWIGQGPRGFGVTRAAGEVAVGGAETYLALAEHSHVATEAGAA